jgi:hypothetical protein
MRTLVIGFIGVTLGLVLAPPTWAQAPAANAPPSAATPSPPMAGKTPSGPTGHTYKAHSHRGYGARGRLAQRPRACASPGNRPRSGAEYAGRQQSDERHGGTVLPEISGRLHTGKRKGAATAAPNSSHAVPRAGSG